MCNQKYLITGPPTHSVEGQNYGLQRRLSSVSVVCNTPHIQRNSPGGSTRRSVVLRPIKATSCFSQLTDRPSCVVCTFCFHAPTTP